MARRSKQADYSSIFTRVCWPPVAMAAAVYTSTSQSNQSLAFSNNLNKKKLKVNESL